jgi:hypothetical protein
MPRKRAPLEDPTKMRTAIDDWPREQLKAVFGFTPRRCKRGHVVVGDNAVKQGSPEFRSWGCRLCTRAHARTAYARRRLPAAGLL